MTQNNRQPYSEFELDEFVVSSGELKQIAKICVKPKRYGQMMQSVQLQRELWIVGPEGVGKRTLALALAGELRAQNQNILVYRIPRSLRWSQLVDLVWKRSGDSDWEASRWMSVELNSEIIRTLTPLPFFESNEAVLSIFVDPRISEWRGGISQVSVIQERVRNVVSFLGAQRNDFGNGLAVFLRVIADSLDRDLEAHADCAELADQIASLLVEPEQNSDASQRHIFIFPDALGSVRLEREDLDEELVSLKRLQEQHFVIVTSSDDVYKQAELTVLRTLAVKRPENLSPKDYTQDNKLSILENHLGAALENGRITSQQNQWVHQRLLGQVKSQPTPEQTDQVFADHLKKWLPLDIQRFVYISLPDASRPTDVYNIVRQKADIDSRINTWFMALDDSTKAFILTLALMANQPSRQIWQTHKDLVERLKVFDANLAIPPLGVLRQRAAPYVTENGVLDFVNSQVYRTVLKEIAQNYREYFTDALDFFCDLSIFPNDSGQLLNLKNEFAILVGEIGKYGLADVDPILLAWGTHKEIGVRTAVGLALEHVVTDPSNMPDVLGLLWTWLDTYPSDGKDDANTSLRWSVGAALWRITTAQTNPRHINQALQILERLASDPNPTVVSSAAYAVHMMVRYVRLVQLRPILNALAKRKGVETKHIVWAINEAANPSLQNDTEPIQLLEYWLQCGNLQRHEIAYYTLLTGTKLPSTERLRILRATVYNSAEKASFTAALFRALRNIEVNHGRDSDEAETIFEQVVQDAEDPITRHTVALILDDLQKRERDSNQSRRLGEPNWVCLEMLEEWISSRTGNLHWIAVYTDWIGHNIDIAESTSRLSDVARSEPVLFQETLELALKESTGDRVQSILYELLQATESYDNIARLIDEQQLAIVTAARRLLTEELTPSASDSEDMSQAYLNRLLNQHPGKFVFALAQEFQSSSQVSVVWRNLERLAQSTDSKRTLSHALQSSLTFEPDAANVVAMHWLSSQDGAWPVIAAHALFGNDDSLASSERASLMKTVLDQPDTLVQVLRIYAEQENEQDQLACQEILYGLASPESGWRQYLVNALVRALRERYVSRPVLKDILTTLQSDSYRVLLADVDYGRLRSEWNARSLSGIVWTLLDMLDIS